MLLHAQHVVPQQARNGTEYTRLCSPFRIVFFLDFRRLQVSVSLLAAITRPITVSNRVYVCADSFPLPASDGGADRTIFSLRVSHQIPRLSSFLCIRSTFFCPTFPNGALAPYNFSAYRDMPTHSPAGCGALHLYSFSSSVRKVPRLHIKTRLRRRFTSCSACIPSIAK